MSQIGKSFDTAKARAARTDETFEKQRMSQLHNHRVIRPGPPEGWFTSKPVDIQAKIRYQMGKGRLNTAKTIKTGTIFKHGERFDAKVEVFIYEELRRRGFAVQRSCPVDDWVVDFNLPELPIMLEVKSWYTADELQGFDVVVSRFRDDILFVEEDDAYKLAKRPDTIPYLMECSERFKAQLLQYATDSAA
jgi:hypothetical protein